MDRFTLILWVRLPKKKKKKKKKKKEGRKIFLTKQHTKKETKKISRLVVISEEQGYSKIKQKSLRK